MKKSLLLCPLLGVTLAAFPQKKTDRRTISNLQAHVTYLSSDKLEGRRTGTPGEQLAAVYIADQMKAAGLAPKGTDGFFQTFVVREGKTFGPNTRLTINAHPLRPGEHFFPLPFSAEKGAKGEVLPGVNEVDNVWLINVKESADEINPKAGPLDFYIKKTKEAKQNGATGVIFFNGPETIAAAGKWLDEKTGPLALPAVWVGAEGSKTLSADDANGFQVDFQVDFKADKHTGTNVIGYIDNGAPATIVLGTGDDASGAAALIELGRLLKENGTKKQNYALIAFSGEELDQFGSKYFVESAAIPVQNIHCMLNIGRLGDEKGLRIGGVGTSPAWSGVLKSSVPSSLKVQYDPSPAGPSDHTSFYRKDVPVLFFFSGDADNINYEGELKAVKIVYDVVAIAGKQPRLGFSKSQGEQ
ncbi:M28 family peptidase [Chitinophaga lutea]